MSQSEGKQANEKNFLQRMLTRVKVKIAAVDLDGLTDKDLRKAIQECDKYYNVVLTLNQDLLSMLMGNPDFEPDASSTEQKCEYPMNASPYEMFNHSLGEMKHQLWESEFISKNQTVANKLAKIEKNYQSYGRTYTHHMRSFIRSYYVAFCESKKELLQAQATLNVAMGDADKGNHGDLKSAQKKYDKCKDKVNDFLHNKLPQYKKEHLQELHEFVRWTKKFHDDMAAVHDSIADYRPALMSDR